jgi:hypothetical protein
MTPLYGKSRHEGVPDGDLSTKARRHMIGAMAAPLPANTDCPNPQPARQSTYARALHRACLILGGVEQLARHLGVSEPGMRAWLEGRDDPPQMVFLAAVEIVLLHLDNSTTAN